jgi:hypothetical protein
MAVYDIGLGSSYQKHSFAKMEYFEIISIEKQTSLDRYTHSK